jgi:hypothetical protein
MSVYKQLLAKDIITTPFVVNKSFSFTGIEDMTSSGIDVLWGKNIQVNENTPDNAYEATTGYLDVSLYPQSKKPSQKNIYSSIRQLYYGNYTSSSVASGSFNSSFANTVTSSYFFPTFSINPGPPSPAEIIVFSIPRELYGEYIKPKSFAVERFDQPTTPIIDDGEGNLLLKINGFNQPVIGNIFYEQGIAVLTKNYYSDLQSDTNFFKKYREYSIFDNYSIKFKSSHTIYETQVKCTIRENEYNYSLNPSLLETNNNNTLGYFPTESNDIKINEDYQEFVTGSDFSPYVTSVGLYNSNEELMALAKLTQPLPTSITTDTTVIINIDR